MLESHGLVMRWRLICGCLVAGHIAQDCFYTPGAKKYDLLEEEEKPIFAGPNQLKVEQQKSTAKSKKKKVCGRVKLNYASTGLCLQLSCWCYV